MPEALYALAVLACPVGMGAMMWFMMRGPRHGSGERGVEVDRLQREVAQLRAEQDVRRTGLASAGERSESR